MDLSPERLEAGLSALGSLLEAERLTYDLVLVGAGAMVLGGHAIRATEDLDVVGFWKKRKVVPSTSFPADLQRAVEVVGRALDLPVRADGAEKDWLNPGPTILAQLGSLPVGFEGRLTARRTGGLTVRLAACIDLVYLKLLAATDVRRPTTRRESDIADLRTLAPTRAEAVDAARWVVSRDGRPETFDVAIRPILAALGHDMATLDD